MNCYMPEFTEYPYRNTELDTDCILLRFVKTLRMAAVRSIAPVGVLVLGGAGYGCYGRKTKID